MFLHKKPLKSKLCIEWLVLPFYRGYKNPACYRSQEVILAPDFCDIAAATAAPHCLRLVGGWRCRRETEKRRNGKSAGNATGGKIPQSLD
jgi:hypothetical protein